MNDISNFYYDGQFRRYILHFMAIFTDLQVRVGRRDDAEPELISVPIHYAAPDRVAAALVNGNTHNNPLRVPVMSAYLRNVQYDEVRSNGQGTERSIPYTPVGGLMPQDTRVIHQRKPLPVRLQIDLNLYASNTDQHFQMLEQILPLFEPQLVIQTSDGVFDWTRNVTVKLTGLQFDGAYPVGTDRRIIQSTLSFEIDGWIGLPADVRRDFVEKIYLRIGAVSTGAVTNAEMIAELDANGFTYDLVKDGNDLDIGDHPTNPS